MKEKITHYIKKNKFILLIGAISGAINGLLGSGGGIILVVASTLFLGKDQKCAQAGAIPAMLCLSILSCIFYFVNKTPLDTNIFIPVAIGSAAGGVLGSLILKKFSNNVMKYIFAAMIIFAGVRMLCP